MNALAHSFIFWIALIMALVNFYFMPTVIAAIRGVEGLGWIIVLNLLPGGIGWPAALITALGTPPRQPPSHASGRREEQRDAMFPGVHARRSHESNLCSTSEVSSPPWPTECRLHHPWQPGKVSITWEPCDCPPARAARDGHLLVRCERPGCQETWSSPLHRPVPRLLGHKDDPYR